MSVIRIPRIVRPGVLSHLKPSSLKALLSPFADYFARRGASLDCLRAADPVLDDVVSVIATPVESTPAELVERLELLDLLSDPGCSIHFEDGYEAMVAAWLEPDDSTADLAVKILIHAPDIAWREFDRQALQARRSLVSFSCNPALGFLSPDASRVARLENLLRPWFEQNARSGICSVHTREEAGGVSFVIRHGDLLKRIGVFDENGRSSSRILRPERVDVAHYRHATGEWQISGIGRRLQELYRASFGTVFHASSTALTHAHRYSLEPLREGPAALACDPHARVQFAALSSLKLGLPGGSRIAVCHGNVFEALAGLNPTLLQGAALLEAKLDLKIATRRRLIPVILNPTTDKVSGIQLDDAIAPWLEARGFFNHHESLLLESA
ncbi:MAG: hypothetical protein EAZ71_12080 [Verrucomicrobia bacterium]|nr:MAG: hypothetical protein EAZ71_12080 [Verrucomicrobiota bacterium]